MLSAGLDSRKMVASELAHLAREARRSVREEDLDLGDPAGVEEQLARGGVGIRVLRTEPELEFEAHRHPRRLAAPAGLHELAFERQQAADDRDRLRRRLLLET